MSVRAKAEKDAAAAAAEGDEKAKGSSSGWELLYCGRTSFATTGLKGGPQGNLVMPTRLRPLVGVDIRFVASGCTARHCVALDANGQCYTWGHNEKGQLGHGDTLLHVLPTVVSQLSVYKIIKASVGRNHTVVVTDDNRSFSFGHNGHGQLGLGSIKNDIESSPVLCDVDGTTNAVCGADFTIWLSSVKDSSILTAGLHQYGQLGQGADNEMTCDPKPRAIDTSFKNTVVKVACGTNHSVAVDSKGLVYTWGSGESGRLGHGGQNDERKPRQLLFFQKHNVLPPEAIVSAGSESSACTAGGGQLYTWGKLMDTNYTMDPKPVLDLSGWNIHCMASGSKHHIAGTDDTCISWGIGMNGELGYGPNGPKSSAKPKKVDTLQGMLIRSVGCGDDLSLIVVDKAKFGHRLDQLDTYNGDTSTEAQVQETEMPSASIKSRGNKRKEPRIFDESEEDSDDDESGEDENEEIKKVKGGRHRKPSNQGRARGALAIPEQTPTIRGRPKKTESLAPRAGSSDDRKRGKRGRLRK